MLLVIITTMLTSCIMWSSSPVIVKNLLNTEKGPRVVTFMTPTPYIADMSIALAEYGFAVKPMPTQKEITEIQSEDRAAKYNEETQKEIMGRQSADLLAKYSKETQREITGRQSASRIAKYNEATTRWGITLQTQFSGMECAFTDFNIHHFTLILTDIYTNQIVLILKQKGSDGPCTTVKPVFGTLAEALSQNW